MQPPSRAEPGTLTWTSPAWVARDHDGRQTADLISLSQMSRAFRRGMLPPDVEVALAGEWNWENIRLVLARYASLAPPSAADVRGTDRATDSLPELELTLTVQKDSIGRAIPAPERADSRSNIRVPPAAPVPTVPPAPRVPPEFPRRWSATPSLREVLDPSLEPPFPPRLASILYGTALVLAAAAALAAVVIGIASLFARLNEASDPRMVVLALLVGIGWLLGGGLAAAVIVVVGRAAAGVVLVAQRIDERLREEQEPRD
jgi:hypothetical protein